MFFISLLNGKQLFSILATMDATEPLHEAILQIYNITNGFATPDQDFVTSRVSDFPIQSLHDSDRLPHDRREEFSDFISIFQRSYEAESHILIANNLSSKLSVLFTVYEDMMMDSFEGLYLEKQKADVHDLFISTYDVSKYVFDSSSMYVFEDYSFDENASQIGVDETKLPDQDGKITVSPDSSTLNDSDTLTSADSDQNKKRPMIDPEAKSLLEEVFSIKKFPNATERNALALKTGLSTKQIRVWFTNKRCRSLKQGQITKVDFQSNL